MRKIFLYITGALVGLGLSEAFMKGDFIAGFYFLLVGHVFFVATYFTLMSDFKKLAKNSLSKIKNMIDKIDNNHP